MSERPSGAGAVMASRAKGAVSTDNDLQALQRQFELFPTPPWAARAGAELIRRLDPGDWWLWEPACGLGHIAGPLRETYAHVYATDVRDWGWSGQDLVLDFLADDADAVDAADWIVTNPPFKPAADFVRHGLRRVTRGVAILARAAWFESVGRYPLFFGEDVRLGVYAPFFERVPMVLGRWDPAASTATAYAWFIFFRPEAEPPWLAQARASIGACAITLPIAPGTRERLWRRDDAFRYAQRPGAPLLDLVAP